MCIANVFGADLASSIIVPHLGNTRGKRELWLRKVKNLPVVVLLAESIIQGLLGGTKMAGSDGLIPDGSSLGVRSSPFGCPDQGGSSITKSVSMASPRRLGA